MYNPFTTPTILQEGAAIAEISSVLRGYCEFPINCECQERFIYESNIQTVY